MFALKWAKLRNKGKFMKSLSLQVCPLNQGGGGGSDVHPACGNVNMSQKLGGISPEIYSKIKIKISLKSTKNRNRYGGGEVSDLHEFDGQSHLSVAAQVCNNHLRCVITTVCPLSSLGLWFHTK